MNKQAKVHIVKSGDSLSTIALRHYGDSSEWKRIYHANRNIIKNANIVVVGQHLIIPDLEPAAPKVKQRSQMTPAEQLANPEEGLSYPIEFEVLELLVGVGALLKGLARQGVKVLLKTSRSSKADDVFKEVVDLKTGRKHYPNSPYRDQSRHPREIMEEINSTIQKDMKDALGSRRIGQQNAEIERIHKEFIETGKWPLKRPDLGDYHMNTPDTALIKARQDYLKALKAHSD